MDEHTPSSPEPVLLEIVNKRGLHARASASLAKCACGFDAEVTVARDGMEVDGSSIMDLLMLGASKGTHIEVSTSGPEAPAALEAISELVRNGFHEED